MIVSPLRTEKHLLFTKGRGRARRCMFYEQADILPHGAGWMIKISFALAFMFSRRESKRATVAMTPSTQPNPIGLYCCWNSVFQEQ